MDKLSLAGSNPIILILAMIIAVVLWMEGYKLYKLAVFFLGFITGFTVAGMITNFIPDIPVPSLVIQIAVGLLLGASAFLIWKFGLFIAAACAAFMVLSNFLESLGTIGMIIAFAAAVVGGFVATKADEPVIMVLTGIAGGFAIPSIFIELLAFVPFNTGFLPPEDSFIWLIVKIVMAAIGIGIQFAKNKEKD